jgi:hypothetical protein
MKNPRLRGILVKRRNIAAAVNDGRQLTNLEPVAQKVTRQIMLMIPVKFSALATGHTGLAAAGSGPAEDGVPLWAIKIRSAHFFRRESKAVGPIA